MTGGTGLIFIQAESVRFSGDGSRISFDDTTGEISGGAFSDVLRGTDHSVDILKGEGGNDVLVSYGAPNNEMDILDGGFGADTLISLGANTKMTGGRW